MHYWERLEKEKWLLESATYKTGKRIERLGQGQVQPPSGHALA